MQLSVAYKDRNAMNYLLLMVLMLAKTIQGASCFEENSIQVAHSDLNIKVSRLMQHTNCVIEQLTILKMHSYSIEPLYNKVGTSQLILTLAVYVITSIASV